MKIRIEWRLTPGGDDPIGMDGEDLPKIVTLPPGIDPDNKEELYRFLRRFESEMEWDIFSWETVKT